MFALPPCGQAQMTACLADYFVPQPRESFDQVLSREITGGASYCYELFSHEVKPDDTRPIIVKMTAHCIADLVVKVRQAISFGEDGLS